MRNFHVGIIGCGNIAETYARMIPGFRGLRLVACSDGLPDRAAGMADRYRIAALSTEALLASSEIDVIVNLTIPAEHFAVSQAALLAGKHVWTEKPLALSLREARTLKKLAEERGLRVGSAPDTFLGGGHQQARALLDQGKIGKVVSGCAAVLSHGMEGWHPNPDFFFRPGGGPIYDLGPYYIASLVDLIGPIARVAAFGSSGSPTRTIGSGPRTGEKVPVLTPTNVHAVLEFRGGAVISFSASWDVWAHRRTPIELYGEAGTLVLPDPNDFDGIVSLAGRDGILQDQPVLLHVLGVANQSHPKWGPFANYRGAGLAEMVAALDANRPHRCSMDLALHTVEVMAACLVSADSGRSVPVESDCLRPAPLSDAEARMLMT